MATPSSSPSSPPPQPPLPQSPLNSPPSAGQRVHQDCPFSHHSSSGDLNSSPKTSMYQQQQQHITPSVNSSMMSIRKLNQKNHYQSSSSTATLSPILSSDNSSSNLTTNELQASNFNFHRQETILSSSSSSSMPSLQERFNELKSLLFSNAKMMSNYSINCELYLDLLNAIYYEYQALQTTPSITTTTTSSLSTFSNSMHANSFTGSNKKLSKFIEFVKPLMEKVQQLQLQAKDFELIKAIGFGNFGQVSVVRHKQSNLIYAMKTLNKAEMLRRAETACYREERDVLLHGNCYDWFTKLYFTFQDEKNLYFIMDYYIGGDLMTLLSKYDDLLPESMTIFYSAQIIKAISVLHEMGYIHRDIKPENILLDSEGHARLADFGSCIKVSSISNDGICTRAVGTPDYISPDVLKAMEGDKNSAQLYDYSVDWWSLGVVIFEALFGETPFYDESLAGTYSKILNHKMCFKFPNEPTNISLQAKDLISNLICDNNKRYKTIEQFKQHLWFKEIDWNNLRLAEPPHKPVVFGPDDTSNFDIDIERPINNGELTSKTSQANNFAGSTQDRIINMHLPFVGFSATFSTNEQVMMMNTTKTTTTTTTSTTQTMNVSQLLEANTNEIEIDLVNCDSKTDRKISDSHEMTTTSGNKKSTTINNKHLKNNEDDYNDDDDDDDCVQYSAEDIKQLECDLKDAQQQWTKLSNLVNEVRKEKISLSEQLKVKEHELESQIEKTSDIRRKLAQTEINKRQVDEEMSRINFELEKERQANYHSQVDISILRGKVQKLESDVLNMATTTTATMMHENNRSLIGAERSNEQSGLDSSKINQNVIDQQHDYISHLEEQVFKLQQQLQQQQQSATTNIWNRQQNDAFNKRSTHTRNDVPSPPLAETRSNSSTSIGSSISINNSDERNKMRKAQVLSIDNCINNADGDHVLRATEHGAPSSPLKSMQSQFNQDDENNYNSPNESPSKIYDRLIHSSSVTWRERRSAKAERHELKELQLSLQNELDEKRRIENDLEDKKRQLAQALNDLNNVKLEFKQIKLEHQQLKSSINSQRQLSSPAVVKQINTNNLTSRADFIASLKRDSSLGKISALSCGNANYLPSNSINNSISSNNNNNNINNNISNYQVPSTLSNQSTNLGDFSTEEGYSEVESAYRQIRQSSMRQQQQQQQAPPTMNWNHTYANINLSLSHNGISGRQLSSRSTNKDANMQFNNSNVVDYRQNKTLALNTSFDQQQQQQQQRQQIQLSPNNANNRQTAFNLNSTPTTISLNRHIFVIRTFIIPLKCSLCTSLMVGLTRQGLVCESCGIACHVKCARAMWNMSCPHDEKRVTGRDSLGGIGTAYSGYVRIPKPGGVRKGWIRVYVVVCDFKLYLYDISSDSSSGSNSGGGSVSLIGGSLSGDSSTSLKAPGVSVSRVIDLTDVNFSVTSVLQSDVIHASKTDISCIFRLSTSMIGDDSPDKQTTLFTQLMLVDRESEKVKWVEALNELHRIVRRNNLPPRNYLAAYPVLSTSQLTQCKSLLTINCCALFENDSRLLIGCDDALLCCYIDLRAFQKLPKGKKVTQLLVLQDEQLIVSLCGRQSHVKLIPIRALDNESTTCTKLIETKNATCFVAHTNLPGVYLSVAVKKTLYIFEITRHASRYTLIKEIQSNAHIQTLSASNKLAIIGTCSSFYVYSVLSKESAPVYLINSMCTELNYFAQNPYEPLACFKLINSNNWLLVFENHGVYVDNSGFRNQTFDLQFVTKCNFISNLIINNNTAKNNITINDASNTTSTSNNIKQLLLAHTDNHIDVYECETGDWIQTINLRQTKPLQAQAEDSILCLTTAFEFPLLVQLSKRGFPDFKLIAKPFERDKQFVPKSNLMLRSDKTNQDATVLEMYKKISKVHISEPSDFQHVSHMGPITKSTLIDLNARNSNTNNNNLQAYGAN